MPAQANPDQNPDQDKGQESAAIMGIQGAGLAGLLPLVLGYAVCSSTLLVANKWALELFPKANLLMFFQFFSSYAVVLVLSTFKIVECDPLEWGKIKSFLPVVFIFYAVLWSNLKALDALGVDLTILFRSLTPFAISIGDYLYLGRAMPSLQSWYSLVTMALCTAFIFVREPSITLTGVLWGMLYYVILSIDMVYLKKITVDVKLTTYGRVLYTNLIAAPPAIILAFASGEFTGITEYIANPPNYAMIAVMITCVLGYGMSFLSWALRAKVSALTFVVIGILCKIGSVVINALFMSKHLTLQSMILVCLGILASTLYEQPKPRAGQIDVNKEGASKDAGGSSNADVEEQKKDEDDSTPPISPTKLAFMGVILLGILAAHFGDVFFQ